jgi:hypothetical protein
MIPLMVSAALTEWRSVRQTRIDDLLSAHASIGGTGPGRRWRTEQLNWALILRVAAEFQGFSRALHDQGVDVFVAEAAPLNAALQTTLRLRLTEGRKLGTGNAQPSALGSDFGRLGMQFWPDLSVSAGAVPASRWNKTLAALNKARNAIAHADEAGMSELESEGWKLSQLATIKRFKRTADGLTQAMDTVVSAHIVRLFGGSPPW